MSIKAKLSFRPRGTSQSFRPSIREIHKEIKELRMLYKQLLDRLVPLAEATQEERKAIEETDEIASEKEASESAWPWQSRLKREEPSKALSSWTTNARSFQVR
jgi:predicted  nucleic acid-binding Zn-ribbon protein